MPQAEKVILPEKKVVTVAATTDYWVALKKQILLFCFHFLSQFPQICLRLFFLVVSTHDKGKKASFTLWMCVFVSIMQHMQKQVYVVFLCVYLYK